MVTFKYQKRLQVSMKVSVESSPPPQEIDFFMSLLEEKAEYLFVESWNEDLPSEHNLKLAAEIIDELTADTELSFEIFYHHEENETPGDYPTWDKIKAANSSMIDALNEQLAKHPQLAFLGFYRTIDDDNWDGFHNVLTYYWKPGPDKAIENLWRIDSGILKKSQKLANQRLIRTHYFDSAVELTEFWGFTQEEIVRGGDKSCSILLMSIHPKEFIKVLNWAMLPKTYLERE